jgi:cytochrome c553
MTVTSRRNLPVLLASLIRPLMVGVAVGAPATMPAEKNHDLFFEARVRPLLIDNCLKCHGAEKQKGGLRLDSHAGLLKGGKKGLVFDPAKPESSRLMTAVSYKDPDLQMPPDDQLSDEQVRVLNEWMAMGAPWPQSTPIIRGTASHSKHRIITDADKQFWSFQPVKNPPMPAVKAGDWCRNEVDRFVLAKLEAEGLAPGPQASRDEFIRRATFDLIGLPPTPAEVDAFAADTSDNAYDKLIDRLLASPRYGERWGRHWLDVVRYAESDGFKADEYRANAWPYRDYVIRSFNDDKPYDRFVTEQLAGDEMSDDPNAIVATGFLRAGLYEYNQRDVARQWDQMLIDVTDVTADAFLGLSMGCARCHDHKFDPILQTDYFRLRSFFAPMLPRNDLQLASAAEKAAHAAAMKEWEEKTANIRAQMTPIEKRAIEAQSRSAFKKFPPETQLFLNKPAEDRTPFETQLSYLVMRQVYDPAENPEPKIPAKEKEKYEALKKQLAALGERPKPLFRGLVTTDVGPDAPPTYIPGDVQHVQEPAFPVVLDGLPITKPPIVPTATSTGRRTALAKWIVQRDNPLTPRVMVNRIWQYHFGRGLVATSGDFGHLGTPPSHPELLDFLAYRFVDQGWRMKEIHRLIMTSATYRQSSLRTMPEVAKLKDPENRWLWRMNTRRLDAEQIRDGMLFVSGELQLDAGGASVDVTAPRRAIFTKVLRNHPDSLMEVFDAPEAFGSIAIRNQTTTATQTLMLINGDGPLKRANALAARAAREAKSNDPAILVDTVYRIAYGRSPQTDEREAAINFMQRGGKAALVDFCHAVLNSSEFLYVD